MQWAFDLKSRVQLNTLFSDGKTVLNDCYFDQPYKLISIPSEREEWLNIIQMSASPGMLRGDQTDFELKATKNSKVKLITQAFQRIYPADSPVKLKQRFVLEENASLVYLPHPTVPHKNANFNAFTEVLMEPNSNLIWSDILACGRSANDEQFKFDAVVTELQVRRADRLLFKDLQQLIPESIERGRQMYYERYTHQALALFIGNWNPADLKKALNTEEEAHLNEVEFGISILHHGGIVVRSLGFHAEALFSFNKALATIAQNCIHDR